MHFKQHGRVCTIILHWEQVSFKFCLKVHGHKYLYSAVVYWIAGLLHSSNAKAETPEYYFMPP